ncbi:hypothetical protein MYK68_19890 [Gordonia sp. PP30]|uniref:hypothetical protein n=1 Tax=unclassified Gordonia (in: high G+C Gram-positive bacteria) TaxID=2657482 RepID=UPI001FFF2281|nr:MULTISPECIES: hypothetical protein [unclassified Gordonia (in: high G+C Gram-positive bacteria)]UQE74924.1 hypothetical protein MYK68_19890 [Gordonia sp. PP30]
MTSLEESAAARDAADFDLRGRTPEERRINAETFVINRRLWGKEIPQWVIDVAEGRLPA